jgi:hypothetical protein
MVECVDCERSSGRREDEREPEHDECRLWVFSERAAVMVSTGGRRLTFTPPPLPLALDAGGNCSASLRVNGARALTLTIFLNSKSTSYWTPQWLIVNATYPSFARTIFSNLSLSV